jgi:hypothetical protein
VNVLPFSLRVNTTFYPFTKKALVFSRGAVEKYLKFPKGESSLNIFEMARKNLRFKPEQAL